MSFSLLVQSLVVHAVSLGQTSLPATGRQETILTLDQPATIHLSARSGSGTSCEVIDRVRGPFAHDGVAGRTNCELDLLLDAGQYKVRVESSPKGKGQVELSAALFTELNAGQVQLANGSVVETQLKPLQQASFWMPMPTRGIPYLRVWGRHAGDVRLWRNGEWLEPIALRHTTVTNTPGFPMHEWWLDQTIEAGDYKLVVYGRGSVTVTGATQDDSLTLERGFRAGPAERAVSFTLPASGTLSFEVPRTQLATHVSLAATPDAQVTLQLADLRPDRPFAFTSACSISKGSLVPECGVRSYDAPDRRIVFLRGPKGTKGTLEWATAVNQDLGLLSSWSGGYYGAPSTNFSFTSRISGRVSVMVHDLPIDSDAAPLGCMLEQTEPTTRLLARSMTRLESGEQLEKDFNYDESGGVVWFEVRSANRYRLQTQGGRKNRCEVYRLDPNGNLSRLTQSKADDAAGCDQVLSLEAGQYQLSLFGGVSGIEKLVVREEGAKQPKKAIAKTSCQLPPVDLTAGRYRLTLTRTGAITARGISTLTYPVDTSTPVHLTLEGRQTITLPLQPGPTFAVRSAGGARFGCQIAGAAAPVTLSECAVPPPGSTDSLTLTNPSDAPVQLTLVRPLSLAAAPGAASYSPQLRVIPTLAPEQPAWFDFDRGQTNSAVFVVDAPGLYNVTTLGLLTTSCRLRTPVVDLVAENQGAGRGRNCLIQTYLQKGRYLLSATTQGQSKGRGALFLTKKPAKEVAGLGSEGETFFRVDANELVQQKLVVPKTADYQLATTAQGASLLCRFDDPQGWPVERVPSPCAGTRTLAAGSYWWTQMPLTVESMRRTKLEKVREPIVLRGNKAHPIAAFTWYDAELGTDGKDEFTFALEGESTLEVVLTQGMQGRVYRLEKDQPPKAVEVIPPTVSIYDSAEPSEEPPPEGEGDGESYGADAEYEGDGEGEGEGSDGSSAPVVSAGSAGPAMRAAPPPPNGTTITLPSGSYKLVTEHSKGDVGITYRLHYGSAVLLPGMARTLPVPTTVPLVIPRDGTLRLKTEGEADVRCRLFDEKRRLVLEGNENGADWNCALAEPITKGKYTLVLESETQLAGETRLSISLPPIEEKGAFTDGQKLTLGGAVAQLTIPAGDSVQELSVKAAGKTPFSCAVVGPEGVAARRSRVSDCSMLVLPKKETWTLRLWTTDGSSAVTATLKARAISTSGNEVTSSQALSTTIAKPGRYRTSPGIFCLRGRATGVFERCGPEASLEAGPVVFAAFGSAAAPVPLDELRFAASAGASSFELSRAAHLQTITASTPSLFLLSAVTGWGEAAAPACGFEGEGALRERLDTACFAVSKVGTEATARIWAATDSLVPASVVRQAVSLPSKSDALAPGRRSVTFSKVGSFSLPTTSRARVEATLPRDTWGVLVDGNGRAVELCSPSKDLRRCVVSSQGGTFVLIGESGQADLTTVLLETAPLNVNFTGLYEDAPRTPGTVRLTIPPADGDRTIVVEGALRCTVVLASGERLTDCRAKLPGKTGAELVIEHDVSPLRAMVFTPGREKWARLGLELPVVAGSALQPAVAVPLLQGRIDRTLVVSQGSVVRVAAESGVCGLFRGNDLLAVDGTDTGCELVRVLTPGTYRLLVRPFANRPQPGSLRWLAEPVTALSEGVAQEFWLAPGEVRLFTFDTKAKGKIGVGLQAKSENLECAVYNDGYQPVGEGCHQYLTLDKGRFLLTVRSPNRPGAAPIAVKPVLLGLSGESNEVPADYLMNFFGRVGVTP